MFLLRALRSEPRMRMLRAKDNSRKGKRVSKRGKRKRKKKYILSWSVQREARSESTRNTHALRETQRKKEKEGDGKEEE